MIKILGDGEIEIYPCADSDLDEKRIRDALKKWRERL
jgi:hypothetical protein